MNQPLMLTATQKAGPTLTALVGELVLLVLLAMPLLSLLPAESPFQVSAYTLTLVGKCLLGLLFSLLPIVALLNMRRRQRRRF